MYESLKTGDFEVLTSNAKCDIYLTCVSYSMLSGVHRFDVARRIQERWIELGLNCIPYDTPHGVGKKWLIPLHVVDAWMQDDNPKLLAKITHMQSLRDYILSQVR